MPSILKTSILHAKADERGKVVVGKRTPTVCYPFEWNYQQRGFSLSPRSTVSQVTRKYCDKLYGSLPRSTLTPAPCRYIYASLRTRQSRRVEDDHTKHHGGIKSQQTGLPSIETPSGLGTGSSIGISLLSTRSAHPPEVGRTVSSFRFPLAPGDGGRGVQSNHNSGNWSATRYIQCTMGPNNDEFLEFY